MGHISCKKKVLQKQIFLAFSEIIGYTCTVAGIESTPQGQRRKRKAEL
jgi:hypothetical protein